MGKDNLFKALTFNEYALNLRSAFHGHVKTMLGSTITEFKLVLNGALKARQENRRLSRGANKSTGYTACFD